MKLLKKLHQNSKIKQNLFYFGEAFLKASIESYFFINIISRSVKMFNLRSLYLLFFKWNPFNFAIAKYFISWSFIMGMKLSDIENLFKSKYSTMKYIKISTHDPNIGDINYKLVLIPNIPYIYYYYDTQIVHTVEFYLSSKKLCIYKQYWYNDFYQKKD